VAANSLGIKSVMSNAKQRAFYLLFCIARQADSFGNHWIKEISP